jgi:hypothetical protein
MPVPKPHDIADIRPMRMRPDKICVSVPPLADTLGQLDNELRYFDPFLGSNQQVVKQIEGLFSVEVILLEVFSKLYLFRQLYLSKTRKIVRYKGVDGAHILNMLDHH